MKIFSSSLYLAMPLSARIVWHHLSPNVTFGPVLYVSFILFCLKSNERTNSCCAREGKTRNCFIVSSICIFVRRRIQCEYVIYEHTNWTIRIFTILLFFFLLWGGKAENYNIHFFSSGPNFGFFCKIWPLLLLLSSCRTSAGLVVVLGIDCTLWNTSLKVNERDRARVRDSR